MNSNEDQVIKYYSKDTHKEFYKKLWGGDCMHVGIYDCYQLRSNISTPVIEEEMSPDIIKNGTIRKMELLYKIILTYANINPEIINTIKIADFGSGFGGTARYLMKTLGSHLKNNPKSKLTIDCYDLSIDNCNENFRKNIESNMNIGVYNTSFCETGSRKDEYNLIISEDAFIHVDDKTPIFKEASRILYKGFFIFSDIFLTDNHGDDIQEVYDRIGITKMETFSSYKQLVENAGFKFCNFIPYKNDMLKHYTYLENLVQQQDDKDEKILNGIRNWIKHIKNDNITTGIFVFKKNEFEF